MALTERDVNAQHPRSKYHSVQSTLKYAKLSDEISPAKVALRSTSKLPRRATPTTLKTPQGSKVNDFYTSDRLSSTGKIRGHLGQQTATNKPLPSEKPLPSRPPLSLIEGPSPTKHSRSLLDASERPLTISAEDGWQNWPALNPCTSETTGAIKDSDSAGNHDGCHSSSSSFVSATEAHARRSASLCSSPLVDKTYSPSPASFSRPRPSTSSLGHGSGSPTSSTLGQTDINSALSARAGAGAFGGEMNTAGDYTASAPNTIIGTPRLHKTASRIPIPDSKKATLVDIKSRHGSGSTTGKPDVPSFGSRRLDGPDLRILDLGIKRRQLNGRDTNGSATSHASTKRPSSPETSTLGRSTPEDTIGRSSSDEEEIATPTDNITRTLTLLEGKGSPPRTEVDSGTVLRMFGYQSPVQCSVTNDVYDHGNIEEQTDSVPMPVIETITSKWSDSTTSDKDLPRTPDTSPLTRVVVMNKMKTEAPPKRLPPIPPRSIGYPSRIPSKASMLIGPGRGGSSTPEDITRRILSPTLGKHQPSSIRATRENLLRGGFARTTASAESKKSTRTLTAHTKPMRLPGERGRTPSAEKLASKSESTISNTPRARSRSRYVLSKLNGMFSARRDKKAAEIPPIPSVNEQATPKNRAVEVATNSSSDNLLMSPTCQPALRGTPRIEVPIESVIMEKNQESLCDWSASLISKAQRESHPARKERMLSFAKVLNDSLISAREAQINAEAAQHAARSAQIAYEMTQKSLAMLQRLAVSLGHRNSRR